MARFARAAYSPAEVRKGIDSFAVLMAEANIAWKAEIQASGLGELFKTKGALYVYESEAAFASGAEERALQKDKGTEFEIIDGNRARELAPGLTIPSCAASTIRTACTPSIPTGWWRPWPSASRPTAVPSCAAGCAASAVTAATEPIA